MSECTNPKIGVLIHAYELNALPAEEEDRFSIHVMECQHCFEQLETFRDGATCLREDAEAKALAAVAKSSEEPAPSKNRLLGYLWPKTPLLFRPAIAYLLALCFMIPTYLWLQAPRIVPAGVEQIESSQRIHLRSTRGAGDLQTLKRSPGELGIVDFELPQSLKGKICHWAIKADSDGRLIGEDDYSDSDSSGFCRLSVPLRTLPNGTYRLELTEGVSASPTTLYFEVGN
jgi:hypothetical protein